MKGPIPWAWLVKAGALPGRALHVGLAVWFLFGLENKRTVLLPTVALASMGVDRHAARRGLAALEKSGLVSVERHAGRKPRVTVLDCPEGEIPDLLRESASLGAVESPEGEPGVPASEQDS